MAAEPADEHARAVGVVVLALEGTGLGSEGRARAALRLRSARDRGGLNDLDTELLRRVDEAIRGALSGPDRPN